MWKFKKRRKIEGLDEIERILRRSDRRINNFVEDIQEAVERMKKRMTWNVSIFLKDHLDRFKQDKEKLITQERELVKYVGVVIKELRDAMELPLEESDKTKVKSIRNELLKYFKELKDVNAEGRMSIAVGKIETLRSENIQSGRIAKWGNEEGRFAAILDNIRQAMDDILTLVVDLQKWSMEALALIHTIREG